MIKHIFCFQALATPCAVLRYDDHHIPNLYLENYDLPRSGGIMGGAAALLEVRYFWCACFPCSYEYDCACVHTMTFIIPPSLSLSPPLVLGPRHVHAAVAPPAAPAHRGGPRCVPPASTPGCTGESPQLPRWGLCGRHDTLGVSIHRCACRLLVHGIARVSFICALNCPRVVLCARHSPNCNGGTRSQVRRRHTCVRVVNVEETKSCCDIICFVLYVVNHASCRR